MAIAKLASRYGAALLAIGLLLMGTPIVARQMDAHAAGSCSVAEFSLDAEEVRFVELLNNYRVQHGLGPLTVSESLTRASAWLVVDLSSKNYFSHTDSLGRSPQTRVGDCGYASPAGENIAAGTDWDSAQEAFDAWKASKGHNENMLYGDYAQVGVARVFNPSAQYGWYWATDFGTVDDGTNMLAPVPAPSPTLPAVPPPTLTPLPTLPPVPTATTPPTLTPVPTVTPSPTLTPTAAATQAPSPTAAPGPQMEQLNLQPGANLVSWPGRQTSPALIGTDNNSIAVIYSYDPATKTWLRFGPGLPAFVNSLHQLEPGQAYWVFTRKATQVFAAP
ncbi:MAG: CAP domain-containing protein [Dehalococcoidia bacterium]